MSIKREFVSRSAVSCEHEAVKSGPCRGTPLGKERQLEEGARSCQQESLREGLVRVQLPPQIRW